MPEWVSPAISLGTGLLLLYVGLVMRNFAKSVERLERVTEQLSRSMGHTAERLARVETKLDIQ